MNKRRVFHTVIYLIPLLILIGLLFQVYTVQNKARIAEQNKNYAEDATRQTAQQLSDQFENGQGIITAYAYFLDTYLNGGSITAEVLAGIEKNSVFDTVRFTDENGVTHLSDGRTVDSSDREYFKKGMQGESGIVAVFDERLAQEAKRIMFYAPVESEGKSSALSVDPMWRNSI